MRARIGVILLSLVVVATGCTKKREITVEKRPASKQHKALAQGEGFPADVAKDEFVFDDRVPELADFAFIDGDDPNEEDTATQLALAEDAAEEELSTAVAWSDTQVSEFEALRFNFDSAKLADGQSEALKKDVEIAKRAAEKGEKVVLDAYACQIGEEAYNLALTQRRANALKKRFVEAGVPEEAIEAVGRGQACPLANTNATERLQRIRELEPNRRAELSTINYRADA